MATHRKKNPKSSSLSKQPPKEVVASPPAQEQKKEKVSVSKQETSFEVLSPATLQKIGELPIFAKDKVEEKISYAKEAFTIWSKKSLKERSKEIIKLRKYLAANKEEIIDTICSESGKSRMDALLEVFTVCESLTYIAKKGIKFLKPEKRSSGLLVQKYSYINYHPYGVVGIISPWNYPLILSLVPIAGALMAGNTVVIKPSEITPYTTLKALEFFQRAGLPEGILQVVTGKAETGVALVESSETKMIYFTGSTATGRKIAEVCGKMLKPVILELGGKDPMIVFEDADILRAARGALWGGFFNSGQTCISVERVYVQKTVYSQFINILKEEYALIKQGSKEQFPEIGSMTFAKQVDIIEDHYTDAVQKGAKVVTGGSRLEGETGMYHKPAILTDVNHSMKIMREETFGPEISIMQFDTEEEAIRLANDSQYGLNASVWSRSSSRAERVAGQISSGSLCINDCITNYMISDLPFGGFKESGLGRSHGPEGLRSFAQSQSVVANRWFWKFSKELWWYPYSQKLYHWFSKGIDLLFK
jgi:acyl-CoA reductase-like NAD-dependent aldehyde dehydrogenase